MTDITEIKKTAERLRYLTFYDSLTGLYNRAYFEEELKRLDTPRQLPLSLILGDINGLKLANDVFGHKEGDKLLISISNKLRANCRGEDLVARWGGDEFIILLPKTGEKEVAEICNRIKKACLECDESIIKTSIALGAVTKRTLDQDLNKLLLEAENKMYKNKLVESKRVHERIIDSLQGYLLNKTHETREHIENTKKIALLMANCLGLSSNKKHELELLAEFHDIGKISVSVEITDERKALTEAEKELIKQHPVIGYRIATASAKLMPIAEEILFHHEWWNGKGYPLGLKGDDIPLIARIFSIANSYDVMIRGYGYRPPMSKHQAIDKINNYAGTQFDPRMVKVFMQIIENNLL